MQETEEALFDRFTLAVMKNIQYQGGEKSTAS